VFRWINGRDPRQYGLDFRLWTRGNRTPQGVLTRLAESGSERKPDLQRGCEGPGQQLRDAIHRV